MLVLLGTAAVAAEAELPAGQAYVTSGNATVRSRETNAERPVIRGSILFDEDVLRVPARAEVGIYFRRGGRRVVQGGDTGITGTVASFLPSVRPYRGEAVQFGATRSREDASATDMIFCMPEEPPIFSMPPAFSLNIAPETPDSRIFSSLYLRVLLDESVVAAASLHAPRSGQFLRLDAPGLSEGSTYILEVVAFPGDATGETLVQRLSFYVAVSVSGETGDLFSTLLFRGGTLPVRPGRDWSSVRFEQELAQTSGQPVISTTLSPVSMH